MACARERKPLGKKQTMQVVCMYHKKTFDGKGEAFHPDELHEYERERERERDCDIHNQRKVVNLKSPLEKKTDMNQIIH